MHDMILYRGEASNANGIRIIYIINAKIKNWSAKFGISNIVKNYTISDNYVEVILSGEDTKNLPLGINYGWFKLVDNNQREATIHAQKFIVMDKNGKSTE